MDALQLLQMELHEREKELECLYTVSRAVSAAQVVVSDLASTVARAIRRALSETERAVVTIELGPAHAVDPPGGNEIQLLERFPVVTLEGREGYIQVSLVANSPDTHLLRRERYLLQAVSALLAAAVERTRIEARLRAAIEAEQRSNVALNEVLARMREGQTERVRLSPREYQVARLIADGLSTKEVAAELGVSSATVERHRHNIRRKFGINRDEANLATFLRLDHQR